MGRLVGKRQYRELLLALGLLCAALALVLWPGEAMGAMRDGLKLCGNAVSYTHLTLPTTERV